MIGIFNRSYYEEVLIVRVHPEIFQAETIPGNGKDEKIWTERYRSIIGLERHLHANGTRWGGGQRVIGQQLCGLV